MPFIKLNLVGKKFNRLTVISEVKKRDKKRQVLWNCKCECGKKIVTTGSSLNTGKTRSCGCLLSDILKERNKNILTAHGYYNHPLYKTWYGIMHRCYNKKNKRYSRYGGRGIVVDEKFKNVSFFTIFKFVFSISSIDL